MVLTTSFQGLPKMPNNMPLLKSTTRRYNMEETFGGSTNHCFGMDVAVDNIAHRSIPFREL